MRPVLGWLNLIVLTALATGLASLAESEPTTSLPVQLRFTPAANGGFEFNTGVLRGELRAGGKSLGLTSVLHIPSGTRLDRSNGLLSHYRVFTKGIRYGGGAWDWPSEARLTSDGGVEVTWARIPQRPFELRALYTWRTATSVEVETIIRAEQPLIGFESFLANYFSEGFTNAAVYATSPGNDQPATFARLRASAGAWQMFPRERAVLPMIQDGRWKLEPNPVDWTICPPFNRALAYRRDPASGLTAVLVSPATDCFAMAGPQETEAHRSLYFSLFGRDVKAGQTLKARTRLLIANNPSPDEILQAAKSSF